MEGALVARRKGARAHRKKVSTLGHMHYTRDTYYASKDHCKTSEYQSALLVGQSNPFILAGCQQFHFALVVDTVHMLPVGHLLFAHVSIFYVVVLRVQVRSANPSCNVVVSIASFDGFRSVVTASLYVLSFARCSESCYSMSSCKKPVSLLVRHSMGAYHR